MKYQIFFVILEFNVGFIVFGVRNNTANSEIQSDLC